MEILFPGSRKEDCIEITEWGGEEGERVKGVGRLGPAGSLQRGSLSQRGLKEAREPAQEAKFQTDLSVGFCSRGRKVNMSADGFPSGC